MKRFLTVMLLTAALPFTAAAVEPAAKSPAPMEKRHERFEQKIAGLPADQQAKLRECDDIMHSLNKEQWKNKPAFEALPKNVQDELKAFHDNQRALFEKLSPEAKEALRTHRRPHRDHAHEGDQTPEMENPGKP